MLPDLGSASVAIEASGVLGTSFYISPEICQAWPHYDNKVDLYSLGVIAFELWHPFTTAMERVTVLRDLVEKGSLPPGWPEAHPGVRTPPPPSLHMLTSASTLGCAPHPTYPPMHVPWDMHPTPHSYPCIYCGVCKPIHTPTCAPTLWYAPPPTYLRVHLTVGYASHPHTHPSS